MRVECTGCLVSKEHYDIVQNSNDGETVTRKATLGYAALDIARNYCGADTAAGSEIVAASQMGGNTVCVWVRLDPILVFKHVV